MLVFEVKDMSCNHCVASITKAVLAEDRDAKVDVDLARHRVEVETRCDAATVARAIGEAGFTPVPAG